MELQKDALLRMVRAARDSYDLAKSLHNICGHQETTADKICNELTETLYEIVGETLGVEQDFRFSKTYTLLFRSAKTNNEVVDEFIRMADKNFPSCPKPNLVPKEQFSAMVEKFGGYSTPEGEWK